MNGNPESVSGLRAVLQPGNARLVGRAGWGVVEQGHVSMANFGLGVLLAGLVSGQILNVGNPAEVTILQRAQTIRELFAPDASIELEPAREGDSQRRRPDIRLIQATYEWEPAVSLEDGLRSTADWVRERLASEAGRSARPNARSSGVVSTLESH